MAAKILRLLLGQSNPEGYADKASLPVSLRGPQANSYIFNYENNAWEILNCDGAGANLPNNTTYHTANKVGPEMSLSAAITAAEGECWLFKFCVPSTTMGPAALYREWNVESVDLSAELFVRFNAAALALAGLGHTIERIEVYWYQGEGDTFIEGNDISYFGMYRRFISDIRTWLANFKTDRLSTNIKWIAVLIHDLILSSGVATFFISRTRNIRAALMKAGWDDPNYRILDADRFSFQNDLIHLDTQGVVDCGEAMYAAALLTYNNTMALEDYSLYSLRNRVAEEFGIDLTVPLNVSRIDKRINDAISWVVNRRKNWPWLEKDTAINVGEPSTAVVNVRYGAAIFSLAQNQGLYSSFSQTVIAPRELVDFEGEGKNGLMVQAVSSNSFVLRQGYRGDGQTVTITAITVGNPTVITVSLATTQGGTAEIPTHVATFGVQITNNTLSVGTLNGYHYATRISATQFSIPVNTTALTVVVNGTAQLAKEFVIAQGYFELPDDYIRNSTAHTDDDQLDNTLYYRHPTLFEREVKAKRLSSIISPIYSVVVDPMGLTSKKYLTVFPYYTDRQTIYVKYFADAKKLIADDDVPDVPRSDRFVVLYASLWFAAQWQKDMELLAFYRDGALNELERMTKEYQLSDDITESLPMTPDVPGPVRGPDSFPEFDA